MSNLFQVEGWIAKDLQTAEGKNGPYVHFRLGEYMGKDKEPRYYQCTAYGDAMQRLQLFKVKKGSRILVSGQLLAEIGPKYENGQATNTQEIKYSLFVESVRLTSSTNNNQNQNAAGSSLPAQAGAGYSQVPTQNQHYGNYPPQQNQTQPPQQAHAGYPAGQPQQQYSAYPVQQQRQQNPAPPMPQQQPAQQSNSYPPPPDDFDALPTANFG